MIKISRIPNKIARKRAKMIQKSQKTSLHFHSVMLSTLTKIKNSCKFVRTVKGRSHFTEKS